MSVPMIDDEVAIRGLVAHLAVLADSGDLADYLDVFTDDAEWEVLANEERGVPASRCVGHAEIGASVEQRRGIGVQGPGTGAFHHITTHHIEVAGDEATGHVYYQFLGINDGKPTIRTLGQYRDGYRRTPAGWKLASRTIIIS